MNITAIIAIIAAVIILILAVVFIIKRKKSDGSASIPSPTPDAGSWQPSVPDATPAIIDGFGYWGEAMPSHPTAESALKQPSTTRQFFTKAPISRGETLFQDQTFNEVVVGKGKWIALTSDADDSVVAVKVSTAGNIYGFKKA